MSGILGSDYLGELQLARIDQADIIKYGIENTGNLVHANLSSAVSNSDTALPVFSLSEITISAPFRITVDSEIMLVTSINTADKQLNVTRGVEGTTATSHGIGAPIYNTLTVSGLADRSASIYMMGPESARPTAGIAGRVYQPLNRFYKFVDDGTNWRVCIENSILPATNINFNNCYLNDGVHATTWVNPFGELFGMRMTTTGAGYSYMYLRTQSYLTPPFTLDTVIWTGFRINGIYEAAHGYHNNDATFKASGVIFDNSVGSKLYFYRDTMSADNNSTAFAEYNGYEMNIAWLRMVDDNTNIKFYQSNDYGATYNLYLSEARSSTADSLIFGGINYSGNGNDAIIYFLSAYVH